MQQKLGRNTSLENLIKPNKFRKILMLGLNTKNKAQYEQKRKRGYERTSNKTRSDIRNIF